MSEQAIALKAGLAQTWRFERWRTTTSTTASTIHAESGIEHYVGLEHLDSDSTAHPPLGQRRTT